MTKSYMTKKLTTSAVLIALAFVLSVFAVFKLPNGGSVTIGSMVPILMIAYLYDTGWGILSALVYSLLQMFFEPYLPPVQELVPFILAVLLDYVIAFSVLGLSGVIYRSCGRKTYMIPVSGAIVIALRFFCHFVSGILVWQSYAPEGQNPAVYSLVYNGSYMLCELIISVAILCFLSKFIQNQIQTPSK